MGVHFRGGREGVRPKIAKTDKVHYSGFFYFDVAPNSHNFQYDLNWLWLILPIYGTLLHTSKVVFCGLQSEIGAETGWINETNMEYPQDNLTSTMVKLLYV